VLVGHSERRKEFGETDKTVNKKVLFLLSNNFVPVICIGEDRITYEAKASESFIKKQIQTCLQGVFKVGLKNQQFVIAYEPR
jgi:triosephosphate isomerase